MDTHVTDMDGAEVRPGDRIEIHPAHDLWMRGARLGTVKRINPNGLAVVKMDHPSVRKLLKVAGPMLKKR